MTASTEKADCLIDNRFLDDVFGGFKEIQPFTRRLNRHFSIRWKDEDDEGRYRDYGIGDDGERYFWQYGDEWVYRFERIELSPEGECRACDQLRTYRV